MEKPKGRTRGHIAFILISFFVVASVVELFSLLRPFSASSSGSGRSPLVSSPIFPRRSLLGWSDHKKTPPVNPIMRERIRPLSRPPEPSQETIMFWHIPKSGGTTVKSIYKCMNQTLAVRVGAEPRFGHHLDKELVVFEPGRNNAFFVNVDVLSTSGILRAEQMGLVPSGIADLIVTTNLNFAVDHLYDDRHKGRILVLFRHPVERLISKFYYSQISTWERSYKPEWKNIDLKYWTEHINFENNFIVKSLAGVIKGAHVTEADYRVAQRTLRQRFVIGLTDHMEESVHRFNIFMGIDESTTKNMKCMDEFFGHGEKRSNSNRHPKVIETRPEWQTLAKHNEYDIRLYEYAIYLFEHQRSIIVSYANGVAAWNGLE